MTIMTIMTTTITDNNGFMGFYLLKNVVQRNSHVSLRKTRKRKFRYDSHCAKAEICVSHKNLRKSLFFPLFLSLYKFSCFLCTNVLNCCQQKYLFNLMLSAIIFFSTVQSILHFCQFQNFCIYLVTKKDLSNLLKFSLTLFYCLIF